MVVAFDRISLLFSDWIAFHFMYIPQFVYLRIIWLYHFFEEPSYYFLYQLYQFTILPTVLKGSNFSVSLPILVILVVYLVVYSVYLVVALLMGMR